MTSPRDAPPGRLLLRVARALFSVQVVTTVIEPAVADVQHEFRAADTAAGRAWARVRGCAALVRLLAVLPFSRMPAVHHGRETPFAMHEPADREILVLLTALCLPLGLIVHSIAGPWVFAVLISACAVAFVLHVWHDRHRIQSAPRARQPFDVRFVLIPAGGHTAGVLLAVLAILLFYGSLGLGVALTAAAAATAVATHDWHRRHPALVPDERPAPRRPEINFASIQVMENMAGLLVVVGSVAILIAGLPGFRLLLLASILVGVGVAAALGAWRLHHPARIEVDNSIAPH